MRIYHAAAWGMGLRRGRCPSFCRGAAFAHAAEMHFRMSQYLSPTAYFFLQQKKYAKTPLNTYGFKNSLSAFRAEGTCMTSPHARSDCRADLSHIEWLSAPTIAAAPVLIIATAGITIDRNERGSATRTIILTNYGKFPPQQHHASGNSIQLSKGAVRGKEVLKPWVSNGVFAYFCR